VFTLCIQLLGKIKCQFIAYLLFILNSVLTTSHSLNTFGQPVNTYISSFWTVISTIWYCFMSLL